MAPAEDPRAPSIYSRSLWPGLSIETAIDRLPDPDHFQEESVLEIRDEEPPTRTTFICSWRFRPHPARRTAPLIAHVTGQHFPKRGIPETVRGRSIAAKMGANHAPQNEDRRKRVHDGAGDDLDRKDSISWHYAGDPLHGAVLLCPSDAEKLIANEDTLPVCDPPRDRRQLTDTTSRRGYDTWAAGAGPDEGWVFLRLTPRNVRHAQRKYRGSPIANKKDVRALAGHMRAMKALHHGTSTTADLMCPLFCKNGRNPTTSSAHEPVFRLGSSVDAFVFVNG